MYCGTNKVACQSQRLIAEALLRLMEGKSYAQISVSEICREAGISRQTFYTLFAAKENVVSYALLENYGIEPDDEICSASCLDQFCHFGSRYILREREMLRLLVENQLTYLLYDSIRSMMLQCDCILSGEDERMRGYTAEFMAGGFTSIAQNYIRSGASETEEEMYRIMRSLFGGGGFS